MKNVKEQMADLKYLVSSENTSDSRGFYRVFVTIAAVLLVIGLVALGFGIVSAVKGSVNILSFCVLPVVLIIIFGIVALLSKND